MGRDMRTLFELLDINSDGNVSVCELIEGLVRLRGPANSIDVQQILSRMNFMILQNEELARELDKLSAKVAAETDPDRPQRKRSDFGSRCSTMGPKRSEKDSMKAVLSLRGVGDKRSKEKPKEKSTSIHGRASFMTNLLSLKQSKDAMLLP